jgi:glycosyltransferase involved in cell wall biosynthesis
MKAVILAGGFGSRLPKPPEKYSCTVVMPCKNEEDNVPTLPARVPQMGAFTEIIFVDDRSTDATAERIRETIAAHPDRRIKAASAPGIPRV